MNPYFESRGILQTIEAGQFHVHDFSQMASTLIAHGGSALTELFLVCASRFHIAQNKDPHVFAKLSKLLVSSWSAFSIASLYFANQAARIYAAAKQLVPMRMAWD